MDIIFDQKTSFTGATIELICIICFHVFALLLEAWCVFYYGHPDDDKYNYGLISKLLVIFGLHIGFSFLVVSLADWGVMEYESGYISGFETGTYWILTLITKELTCFFVLPYAQYFMDADHDKGIFKPWSKALVWTVIKSVIILIVYLLIYCVMKIKRFEAVKCLPLFEDDPTLMFTPSFGEPSCIPLCEVHWYYDPSVCLKYTLETRTVRFDMMTGFLVINQCIGLFIFVILFSIGIVWMPYRSWVRLGNIRKTPITSETDLKVAHAEMAELSRALSTIGEALRQRRRDFSRQKTKLYQPSYLWSRLRLNIHTNRYTLGCYSLFDQADLIEQRRIRGAKEQKGEKSVFLVPWAWLKFGFSVTCSLVLVLYLLVCRIGSSFRDDNYLSTANSPLNLLSVLFADIEVFPLTATFYFTYMFTLLLYCIAGFKGLFQVFPISTPFRSTKKGRVKMREMTKICFMLLFVCSGLPFVQSIHLPTAGDGTWVTRNLFSLLQRQVPGLSSHATFEWVGLFTALIYSICALIWNPSKYPFGLDNEPLTKAEAICKKWRSGEKSTNKFQEKIDHVDAKMKKKSDNAKSNIAMNAGKAQLGL
eukprot:GHVH01006241.1.p1 GENE.GHVH01006241.1~~GHVH01006241.1.p1  ORF type:complete len:592 (+),score=51.49 GHVH01006241.1:34-1809(+)